MGLITKIKHSSHSEHFLLLKRPQEPYECDGCKGLGLGPCYKCEHEDCNFYLHQECAKATPSASHPFSKCTLRFHSRAPQKGERYCDACGQDVLGFVYQCKHDKNPHNYHPSCLKLQRTLTAEDGTRLHLRKKLSSKCLNCESRKTSNGIKGWSYVSSCGRYRYHVACVKDMVLKKWMEVYFLQYAKVNETDNSLALQSAIPSRELELPSRKSSSKAKKTWIRKATKAIMIIISALFGDPTTLFVVAFQQLLSD